MEKRQALVESPVKFDRASHEYTLNGHQLSGVTPIISWLFPETYRGIPKAVLDKAAEYGSMIHAKIEMADQMGVITCDPVEDYMALKDSKGLTTLCNEYLVSDEESVASSIDVVFDDDSLADVKTTSKVHVPLVTLQLSIYAWLYEGQNPGRKVNKLYCIWLPKPQYGSAEIIELERVPWEVCSEIVCTYIGNGDPKKCVKMLEDCGLVVESQKQRVEGEVPDGVQELIDELIIVKKQLDVLTPREKEIKQQILDIMQERGEDKWQSDLIQVTKVAASERSTVDSKLLEKKYPEAFKECQKVTRTVESIRYKLL